MRKVILLILFISAVLFFLFPKPANGWGFFGHKKINRMAVFCLPSEMMGFYKKHIEFITEHAVDPDKRRYAVQDEAARHYIDIDHYGPRAFDSLPQYWNKALAKYSEDTLKAYGIVPWYIDRMMYKLTEAFKKENTDLILRYSADIGHYIADAHVPLHTTQNYNGQLSNQKGIHAFWESRIPELNAEEYDYFVGQASYIESPVKRVWEIIKESHSAVDSVLGFEKELNSTFPQDKKYSYETRGTTTLKNYSREYTLEYDKMIEGQVERRMRAAILTVSSAWYTCWINAGKPDLNKITDKDAADSLNLVLKREEEQQQKLKVMKGHEDE